MCIRDRLGPGKQRDAITVLGYLFYIGDRTKTDLPYLENTPGNHEWYQLRHQKAMNSEAVVRLAEASQDRYGFKDFKLKGLSLIHISTFCVNPARKIEKKFIAEPVLWSMGQNRYYCATG